LSHLAQELPLKHMTEGKTQGMGRRGTGCKQLLDDLKKRADTGT